VKIQVNQGSIPDDVIPDFFEIFTSSGTVVPGGDLGLDPPIAERIIKLFGGSVFVENIESSKMLFTVKLKSID
ncbi:MAG: HAMP domain-containing histidine kinase, partial [Planctomycetes bacterium]|nr:HAMP domain-containing histidine kinase [Planctomycetota bacterium]